MSDPTWPESVSLPEKEGLGMAEDVGRFGNTVPRVRWWPADKEASAGVTHGIVGPPLGQTRCVGLASDVFCTL